MKNLLFIGLISLCSNAIGQNAHYIITEKWDGSIVSMPTYDSVYVTDPSGITTTYSITPLYLNVAAHDAEFSTILNGVTNQGYQIVNYFTDGYNNTNLFNQIAGFRSYFLRQPWTSVVEELTPSSNLNNELIVYPNPSNNKITLLLNNAMPKDWSFYVVDINGLIIIQEKGNIIDVSSLTNGNYVIYGVKEGEYLEGIKLIKK